MRAPKFSSWARIAGVAVAAAAATVAAGTPAQALPSGTGWAASWGYNLQKNLEISGKVPGMELTATATDVNGVRKAAGTLKDTSSDGRCAVVLFYSGAYIVDRTICGNGKHITFESPEFSGTVLIAACRRVDGQTTLEKCVHQTIPSSVGDPGLRTNGTGASWSYHSATDYTYSARRRGAQAIGWGSHKPGNKRYAHTQVKKTTSEAGCVSAKTASPTFNFTGSECDPGQTTDIGAHDLTGWIQTSACAPFDGANNCVTVHVPEPY